MIPVTWAQVIADFSRILKAIPLQCRQELAQQDDHDCRQLVCVGGGGQHCLFFVVLGFDIYIFCRGRSGVITAILKGVPDLGAVKIG